MIIIVNMFLAFLPLLVGSVRQVWWAYALIALNAMVQGIFIGARIMAKSREKER